MAWFKVWQPFQVRFLELDNPTAEDGFYTVRQTCAGFVEANDEADAIRKTRAVVLQEYPACWDRTFYKPTVDETTEDEARKGSTK